MIAKVIFLGWGGTKKIFNLVVRKKIWYKKIWKKPGFYI